jgi:hypothetical protein
MFMTAVKCVKRAALHGMRCSTNWQSMMRTSPNVRGRTPATAEP